MHTCIFKGIHRDELMCTHVYALMWTHTHTHWGEKIPCSFIAVRPPWIEMTWQLLLMSERSASTITHTHTHTHTHISNTERQQLAHREDHTHTRSRTHGTNWVTIKTTDPYHAHAHTLGGAIWGAASVAACGINGNTGGNCSKLWRHTINLDRKTYRERQTAEGESESETHFCSSRWLHTHFSCSGRKVVTQSLWYISRALYLLVHAVRPFSHSVH